MTEAAKSLAVICIAITAIYFNIKFILRKLLLVLGFPKIETRHPNLGVYDVGAIKIRLSPDFPTVQLFYPAAKGNHKKFVSYWRPRAVEGLMKFLGTGGTHDGILQFVQDAPHPNLEHYGADPCSNTNGSKFPLVIFSHGISGTIEMYSQICSQMASLGSVVVAPEHADTSASYSTKILENGTVQEIWYQPAPPNSVEPYSRKKVVGYRGPMAELRVDELTALYQFFKSGKTVTYKDQATDSEDFSSVANAVLETVDPLQLHLVGHSFGAATQLLAAQRWAIERNNATGNSDHIAPLSVTALDTWNYPLSEEIVSRGIPSNKTATTNPPILSIISEEWLEHPEIDALKDFLRNSQPHCSVKSYYAKGSMHQSFSDTQAWMPDPVAVAFENRGAKEARHATCRATVSAFAKLTGIGHHSLSPSKADPIEALADFPID